MFSLNSMLPVSLIINTGSSRPSRIIWWILYLNKSINAHFQYGFGQKNCQQGNVSRVSHYIPESGSKDTAESKKKKPNFWDSTRQTGTKVLLNLENASVMAYNECFLSNFHLKGSSLNHYLIPDQVIEDNDLWYWSWTQLWTLKWWKEKVG